MVNKVFLVGNLGKDPELRFAPSGTAIAKFPLATSERRQDANGNWTDHTEWHNIVVFGKQAENCNQYLQKGRQVCIEGSISTRQYDDKDGNRKYFTEIKAFRVHFIGSRGGGDAPSRDTAPDDTASPAPPDDDDVPF